MDFYMKIFTFSEMWKVAEGQSWVAGWMECLEGVWNMLEFHIVQIFLWNWNSQKNQLNLTFFIFIDFTVVHKFLIFKNIVKLNTLSNIATPFSHNFKLFLQIPIFFIIQQKKSLRTQQKRNLKVFHSLAAPTRFKDFHQLGQHATWKENLMLNHL